MVYVITTYDWVPDMAVGHVRDLRIAWACEEAGLPYRIVATPLRDKTPEHFARQPFGQVPILQDGDLSIFESGAILLHLGDASGVLMPGDDAPGDAAARAEVRQWLIASLNSLEPAVLALTITRVFDKDEQAAERALPRLAERLAQLEVALGADEFIAAGRFSVADIVLTDVLRNVDSLGALAPYPGLSAYLARMTSRPAFFRALAGQQQHFRPAA